MVLELIGPTGTRMGIRSYALKGQGDELDASAAMTGWYTLRIRSVHPPAANPQPSYKLTVTYQAPQETIVSGDSGVNDSALNAQMISPPQAPALAAQALA
jgi:hypothetical protein